MKYNRLGRTNIKVSEIAIGCEGLNGKSQEECNELIKEASNQGINFIDFYASNPDMRSHFGEAIKGNRDKWVIEGHICSVWKNGQYLRTRKIDEVKEGFKDLLDRMQTDYIDVGMIHYVDAQDDYDEVFNGNVIKYAKELKDEGKIKAIGISSHNPTVALQAAKTGLIDVILFSINPCYDMQPPTEVVDDLWDDENYKKPLTNMDPVRKEFYEYAQAHDIALTVMKAFGGGDLLDAKMSPFGIELTANQCIHYCLTRPGVEAVMAGCHSVEEIQDTCKYETASMEEKDFALALSHVKKHTFKGNCVYCGHCAPCPKGIDVASVNKFLDLAIAEGKVVETVREHYNDLKHHASECVKCGSCEKNCPFGVSVIKKMEKAVEVFGK